MEVDKGERLTFSKTINGKKYSFQIFIGEKVIAYRIQKDCPKELKEEIERTLEKIKKEFELF